MGLVIRDHGNRHVGAKIMNLTPNEPGLFDGMPAGTNTLMAAHEYLVNSVDTEWAKLLKVTPMMIGPESRAHGYPNFTDDESKPYMDAIRNIGLGEGTQYSTMFVERSREYLQILLATLLKGNRELTPKIMQDAKFVNDQVINNLETAYKRIEPNVWWQPLPMSTYSPQIVEIHFSNPNAGPIGECIVNVSHNSALYRPVPPITVPGLLPGQKVTIPIHLIPLYSPEGYMKAKSPVTTGNKMIAFLNASTVNMSHGMVNVLLNSPYNKAGNTVYKVWRALWSAAYVGDMGTVTVQASTAKSPNGIDLGLFPTQSKTLTFMGNGVSEDMYKEYIAPDAN
jgi:hypothetical protein